MASASADSAWPPVVIWEIRWIASDPVGTMTTYVSEEGFPDGARPWMCEVIDAVREWHQIDPWYPGTNGSAR